MGLKGWGPGFVIIFTLVGVQTAHAMYPLGLKKYHLHAEKYEPKRTTDNMVTVQTSGNHFITPGTGSLITQGHEPNVQVNPI